MEVSGSTWALCRMNMFLHGADSARIEWCNTLTSPALIENDKLMKFNVIVANPPFSLDKWGAEEAEADKFNRFWRGIPPKSKGDYAFISHMIEAALDKEGRIVMVVPHGVLFRGSSEGKIRQSLIESNLLDAVIGLAPNLFPSTSIPVAILVFDKAREKGGERESCKNVLFIDASKEYNSGKSQNTLAEEHLKKILETFKKRETIEKYSYLATIDEIKENDFNLNIPRYVDTSVEEEEIDIQLVQKEIKQIEIELVKVKAQIEGYLGELGL
jgi:type I restriction enzyme M protein